MSVSDVALPAAASSSTSFDEVSEASSNTPNLSFESGSSNQTSAGVAEESPSMTSPKNKMTKHEHQLASPSSDDSMPPSLTASKIRRSPSDTVRPRSQKRRIDRTKESSSPSVVDEEVLEDEEDIDTSSRHGIQTPQRRAAQGSPEQLPAAKKRKPRRRKLIATANEVVHQENLRARGQKQMQMLMRLEAHIQQWQMYHAHVGYQQSVPQPQGYQISQPPWFYEQVGDMPPQYGSGQPNVSGHNQYFQHENIYAYGPFAHGWMANTPMAQGPMAEEPATLGLLTQSWMDHDSIANVPMAQPPIGSYWEASSSTASRFDGSQPDVDQHSYINSSRHGTC